ncbi:MAG: adhesin transport system outer membrane protein [Lentisphaeria bacterium]|jgi:adhesin transport system outer membrane protein
MGKVKIFVGVLALTLVGNAEAVEPMDLREAVSSAAVNNPGVQASWNAFEASRQGVRAAKGGYYPKLDLSAEGGNVTTEDPQRIAQSFDAQTYSLTLTQMLFDGFATKQDVARQNYVQLARYYEFRQVSEDIALETAQAYSDVLRYRKLVALAKENYFQHLRYHKDIEKRVNSGIGRGVDLEQARARLALSESNVLTEATNLHDVSVRFHRLVGYFPSRDMLEPSLSTKLIPSHRTTALEKAFIKNPSLNAAIEGIRSSRADLRGRKAPMMPRLDLRLRKQIDENVRGLEGKYDEEAIELVLTYNLYNGGSDSARKRQSRYLMLETQDVRDRVCREVRQTVSIAYNDIGSKRKLVGYLTRNVDAISKAREAYKNQFDIGQRTLLNLLDTENEYFEVKRTLINAESDFLLSQVRTLAGMGELLHSMNIEGSDADMKDELDLSREKALSAGCPAEAPGMEGVDFGEDDFLIAVPLAADEAELRLDVKFKHGSSEVSVDAGPELARVAKYLCGNPELRATVEGHTDSRGADDYNLYLSKARAESVRDALAMRCAPAQKRLSAIGYGESRPIALNSTDLGRALNRRVVLLLKGVTEQTAEFVPESAAQ